jgi:AcrR family transcriptional regulator
LSVSRSDEAHVSDTKQRIAETFERHVNSHGYQRATLDDVARELRISKKTIYVHFDGKRDIYAHVVARQAREMKLRLAARVAPLATFAARVEAAVRAVLDEGRAHIDKTSQEEWLAEYEIAADAFRAANGELLRELVQGGMDAGEFRPGDAALVEKMVAAMLVEYLVLVNADPSYDRDAELLERIVRFVG